MRMVAHDEALGGTTAGEVLAGCGRPPGQLRGERQHAVEIRLRDRLIADAVFLEDDESDRRVAAGSRTDGEQQERTDDEGPRQGGGQHAQSLVRSRYRNQSIGTNGRSSFCLDDVGVDWAEFAG